MTVGRIGNPSHNHSVPGLFPFAGRLSITANTNHDEVIFAGFPYDSIPRGVGRPPGDEGPTEESAAP